jgi:hypothetical protein
MRITATAAATAATNIAAAASTNAVTFTTWPTSSMVGLVVGSVGDSVTGASTEVSTTLVVIAWGRAVDQHHHRSPTTSALVGSSDQIEGRRVEGAQHGQIIDGCVCYCTSRCSFGGSLFSTASYTCGRCELTE